MTMMDDPPVRAVFGQRPLPTDDPAALNAVVDALSGLGMRDVNTPASPNVAGHAIQAARTNPASINDGGSQ